MKKMLLRRCAPLALVLACVAGSAGAQPQFKDAEEAIKFRQSAFSLMGAYSGGLAAVVRGNVPYNAEQVKADVAVFQVLAQLPWQAFGPGTEGGNARPAVWQDKEKFTQAASNLESSMKELSAAADSGDLGRLRSAFGNTANSCRACHDDFRQRR